MTAAVATLNPAAAVALASCEQRIERGLKTFIDVGQALAEIRDSRLYKGTHDTFEDYCRERWGFSRQRAQQFTAAADLATTMVDTGLPEPTNERQVRALSSVPEPERADIWREATERTGGKPTAKVVTEIAKERSVPPAEPERKPLGIPDPNATRPTPVPSDEQRAQLVAAIPGILADAAGGMTVEEIWTKTPSGVHSSWVEPALNELVAAGRVEPAGRAPRGNRMEPLWTLAEVVDQVPTQTPEPVAASTAPVGSGSTSEEKAPEVPTPTADPVAAVAAALDKHVPDPEAPKRAWQRELCVRLEPISKLTLWLNVEQAAQFADETDVETLRQLALSFADLHRRVVAARTATVTSLRRIK